MSIPKYLDAWRIDMVTGEWKPAELPKTEIDNTNKKLISYSGNWKHTQDSLSLSSSDKKDDSFSLSFNGRQIALYGLSELKKEGLFFLVL